MGPACAGMTCVLRARDSPCAQLVRCHLSPLPRRCGILRLPLPATGRGWAHSPSSWQRAAPGRRAEWLEIREARTQPFPVKCQQWRGAGDRPSGSRCDGARSGNGQRAPEAKECPGTEIAGAGAVRQPPGREALRAREGSPRRPARVSWSWATSSPVADEAPAYPSHLRPVCRGRTARGRGSTSSPRGWRKRAARFNLVLSPSKDATKERSV